MPIRLTTLLALVALSIAPLGCAAIGDRPDLGGEGDPNDPSDPNNPNNPEDKPDPSLCLGDGGAGGACEVTGDCAAPLVCLNGQCVGPQDPDVTCDPIEGVSCANAGEECVGGVCVINPGACQTVDECPLGFVCSGGQCVPERDGMACADPGPGPDLAGTWKFDSKLHLREALPGAVDKILDIAEDLRDLLDGKIDLGLPGIVESIIGGAVASIVRQYVPNWAQDLVYVLGDMSDIINDMRVESTVVLEGQPCNERYRGSERWDWITFVYRGTQLRVPPSMLPGVDEVVPDEFSAWYSCGELFIDKHRIEGSMSQLVRWLLDTVTQAVTGYPTVEQAVINLVDCYQIAVAIDNYVYQACSFCPVVTGIVNGACTGLLSAGVSKMTQAIDETIVELSLIKRKGIGNVDSGTRISNGTWYGSLAGGDFPGEFTATKQ